MHELGTGRDGVRVEAILAGGLLFGQSCLRRDEATLALLVLLCSWSRSIDSDVQNLGGNDHGGYIEDVVKEQLEHSVKLLIVIHFRVGVKLTFLVPVVEHLLGGGVQQTVGIEVHIAELVPLGTALKVSNRSATETVANKRP